MANNDALKGYNDLIILSILLGKDSYGYEISKMIQLQTNGEYLIKETTLYSAFTRLEKNGYLESYFGHTTFGKRRTYYRITSTGIKYFQEKCSEWFITKKIVEEFIKETPLNGKS